MSQAPGDKNLCFRRQLQPGSLMLFDQGLLQFLNSFRRIADFKDLPGDDYLVIGYADWNSDETELILQIRQGSSCILNPDAPSAKEILKSANILAELVMEKLSAASGL